MRLVFYSASETDELPLLFAIGGIVLVNVLFFFLMGAPTPLGTRMMDGIDGLRQYMTLAEKDRMNMQGAPEMSPRHFETLLPYAVALGVEKPWTQTFDRWLLAAAAGRGCHCRLPAVPGTMATASDSSPFGDRDRRLCRLDGRHHDVLLAAPAEILVVGLFHRRRLFRRRRWRWRRRRLVIVPRPSCL